MKILKAIHAGRVCIFSLISVLLFGGVNLLFQPVWLEWNNYDTIHGFYEQPENTIETVFLGASIAINGFTPMELYEDYGICAWNLATEQQPMLASYYWLAEAYQYHSDTLKTVVLDVSMLRSIPDEAYYQKALMEMRFSGNKLEAIKACTDTLDDFLAYLFPIVSYHTRWKELDATDFEILDYDVDTSVRGYNFATEQVIDYTAYQEIGIPDYLPDEEAGKQLLKKEALLYLKKMIEFCQEQGLELILTKTPGSANWTDIAHNAVQEIADDYELAFIDFNYSPYLEESGYVEATDSRDEAHMNYYGAAKLTDWFGQYLTENCDATDVRGMEEYSFLEEDLADYHRRILSIELNAIEDPCEYIQTVSSLEDYTILISVMDDGTYSLTQEQRDAFAQLGLEKLSELQYRDSYLAVVENGQVVYEASAHDPDAQTGTSDTAGLNNDLETVESALEEELLENALESEKAQEEGGPLEYTGQLPDGAFYTLVSGGATMGDTSSCVIGETEYSPEHRGLNIVVYDHQNSGVADEAYFDTCASSTRTPQDLEEALEEALEAGTDPMNLTGQLRSLYLYNCRAEDSYKIKSLDQQMETYDGSGLNQYLSALMSDENYIILLAAQGDAAFLFDEESGEQIAELGLEELGGIQTGESYIGVIDGGEVVTERIDSQGAVIQEEGLSYKVSSSGTNSGGVSSIEIDDAEYSLRIRGINLAVYNKNTGEVIDFAAFGDDAHAGFVN